MVTRIVSIFTLCFTALIVIGTAALSLSPTPHVEASQTFCNNMYTLGSGLWARLTNDEPSNLRAAPGLRAERIGRIEPGDIVELINGTTCADGYAWWEARHGGQTGWVAVRELAADDIWWQVLDGQTGYPGPMPNDLPDCLRPPDDYTRIDIGWVTLNLRTLAMLDHAQQLYSEGGGIIRFRTALMQGSYNAGGIAASFGTHDGGGAVDLSVRDAASRMVLEREIEPMLHALRSAGFAAWLRTTDQLFRGSVIHIHAIAVGDAELSEAARAQIDGEYGYLRGYNGLPPEWGGPARDDMPVVICDWMRALGFAEALVGS